MLDLGKIRDEIDVTDDEIVRLFQHRMALTAEVAQYKIETGKAVFVKLWSKKENYAMLKTEDYRLAVQSLSVKGVIFRNCKQQCEALVCMQTSVGYIY